MITTEKQLEAFKESSTAGVRSEDRSGESESGSGDTKE